MITIKVKCEPSESSDTKEVDLEDLNLTDQEWNKLSKDQQEEKLNNYLSNLPEQPTWMVNTFEELED